MQFSKVYRQSVTWKAFTTCVFLLLLRLTILSTSKKIKSQGVKWLKLNNFKMKQLIYNAYSYYMHIQ